jgi:electron transfer flavoprotein alpha subunit
MDRILVVIEREAGRIASLSYELLKAGAELSQQGGEALCACLLGHGAGELADEIAWYASEVYVIDNPLLSHVQPDVYVSAAEALCRAVNFRTVLMGHTHDNLDIAPKLACRMGKDAVTDCVKIERDMDSGALLCTKPIYGGNAIAVLEVERLPQIATLRPKAMGALQKGNVRGEIISFPCELHPSPILTVSLVHGENVSLDKADAIVAAGRGVKTAQGIMEMEALVQALSRHFDKVELAASRPLVEEGLLPRSRQVGQTGEKVSPELYIAVGISGAAQHMAGAAGSKKIIAINKDSGAPIFEASDYGIVGLYEEILPAFINKLEILP